ncbi:DMT family transporter [Terriglobus sp.]|uniref:DMT family transporter n=1 Tax=Terriglobus sp. TaxID=1889013 RepID=UPI003B00AD5D
MTTARKHTQPNPRIGFLACGSAAFLWGLGFFFGKIALRELPVAHMVLYRFLFAAVTMLPFVPLRRMQFSGRDWRLLALGAFFGIPVQFLMQFYGLAHTTLAHASLMVGTMPVILAVGASVFLHERLDAIGWLALAGSCAGAGLIALSHSSSTAGSATVFGDGLVIASMLVSLFWILTNKRLMDRHSPAAVSSYGLLLGAAMLAAVVIPYAGLPPVRHLSLNVWAASAGSGVLCTTATTLLWNWGMTRVPASQAAVLLNLEPMIGSALSVWLFSERLGWTAWLGAALIVGCATSLTARHSTAVVAEPALSLE